MPPDTLLSDLAATSTRRTSDETIAGLLEKVILSDSGGGGGWWGVVDVVNPATTFYRRKGVTAERSKDIERKLLFGKYAHEQLAPAWFRELEGFAVAEGSVDGAHAGLGGIRGRIDFRLDRSIVELKTTELKLETPQDIWRQTPQDLEQLLLYALMTMRPHATHLLVYYRHEAATPFRGFKTRIRDPGVVKQYFLRRKSDLEQALTVSDPSRLGRCRYFEAGCDLRTQGLCRCSELPPLDTAPIESAVDLTRDEALERRLLEILHTTPPLPRTRVRSWDLFVPRQAFRELSDPQAFEMRPPDDSYAQRLWVERKVGDSDISEGPADMRLRGLDGENSSIGWAPRIHLRRTTKAGVEEQVLPILFRVPKQTIPKDFIRIPEAYVGQLALRCAILNCTSGILAVVFPRSKYQCLCFRYDFSNLTESRTRIQDRYIALQGALQRSSADRLPPCPTWIQPKCGEGCLCRPGQVRSGMGAPEKAPV